jgi:hypothetical protein
VAKYSKEFVEVSKMPIHFNDIDVSSEVAGLKSVLIVPCNMCPAATVAIREKKPFMQLFRSLLKSLPFEQYLQKLQDRLREQGVNTEIFRSNLYHQWFMCMWTSAQRKKLQKIAQKHEAVLVLGCDSATETVRDSVEAVGCKVIEGMKVTGIMNATLKLSLPGNISFEDCRIVPIS